MKLMPMYPFCAVCYQPRFCGRMCSPIHRTKMVLIVMKRGSRTYSRRGHLYISAYANLELNATAALEHLTYPRPWGDSCSPCSSCRDFSSAGLYNEFFILNNSMYSVTTDQLGLSSSSRGRESFGF